MNYYFDDNNRYQIIFPYTSDKIHVERDIEHGASKCYQELKDRDTKTYIFMVHDIDAGTVYYFNIPKYKHLQNTDADKFVLNSVVTPTPHTLPIPTPIQIPTTSTSTSTSTVLPQMYDIIMRLNHVEYQLDVLKKTIVTNRQKEEDTEENCTIM